MATTDRKKILLAPLTSQPPLELAIAKARKDILKCVEDNDVEGVLEGTAMESVLTMHEIMRTTTKERVRADMAKELAHMAGYKPVERRLNLNRNVGNMNERELDSLIISSFSRDEKLVKLLGDVVEAEYEEGDGCSGGVEAGVGHTVSVSGDDDGGEEVVSEVNTAEEVSS